MMEFIFLKSDLKAPRKNLHKMASADPKEYRLNQRAGKLYHHPFARRIIMGQNEIKWYQTTGNL